MRSKDWRTPMKVASGLLTEAVNAVVIIFLDKKNN